MISEALVELTADDSVWQGENADERLRQAFVLFTTECRRHRVSQLVAISGSPLVFFSFKMCA